jgi:hypothetical protein
MKTIIGTIFAAGLMLPVYSADKQVETKKVCVNAKDSRGNIIKNKDGSARQECREIKIHKKFEGTVIPKK